MATPSSSDMSQRGKVVVTPKDPIKSVSKEPEKESQSGEGVSPQVTRDDSHYRDQRNRWMDALDKGGVRPFRTKVFLLRSLAAVFAVHMGLGTYALVKCGEYARERGVAVNQECPEVAQRISELFSVATATVLSLLSAEMGNQKP